MAAQSATSGDVWFVPALLGLGTPVWDFGARGHARRAHPRLGTARDRPRRARRRRAPGGRPGRGERARQRLPHRGAPHRRRHDGQRRVRPRPGRCHRAPRRDLAGAGGHHAGGGPPGRLGGRDLRHDRRARTTRSRPGERSSPAATTPSGSRRATAGWRPGTKPRARFPSSRASPSDRTPLPRGRREPALHHRVRRARRPSCCPPAAAAGSPSAGAACRWP